MSAAVYERIRAACCDEHGLATGVSFRDDPVILDLYAQNITAVVLKARREQERKERIA